MSSKKGVIYAVSIGHSKEHVTPEAQRVLQDVDVMAGHQGFIEMARGFLNPEAIIIDDRITRRHASTFEEAQQNRVAACVQEALNGKKVAILSGGDTGIWGEAAFFLEAQEVCDGAFDVRVVPGVASLIAAASRVGAPLMNGFTLISLGDEDTPFSLVERRLKGAALGGSVIVLYKVVLESSDCPEFYPQDKYPELFPPEQRTYERLKRAHEILAEHIAPETPMMIITDLCDQTSHYSKANRMLGSDTGKEEIVITEFGKFLKFRQCYRFFSIIIIGDSTTRVWKDKIYTPQWSYNWRFNPKMIAEVKDIKYLRNSAEFFDSL